MRCPTSVRGKIGKYPCSSRNNIYINTADQNIAPDVTTATMRKGKQHERSLDCERQRMAFLGPSAPLFGRILRFKPLATHRCTRRPTMKATTALAKPVYDDDDDPAQVSETRDLTDEAEASHRIRFTSRGACFSDFILDESVLRTRVDSVDPSQLEMLPGDITLYHTGDLGAISYSSLREISQNKPCDILIWQSASARFRAEMISYQRIDSRITKEDAIASTNYVNSVLSVVGATYLLHGSVGMLDRSPPQVPKFALDSTGLSAEMFAFDKICSVKQFKHAKFKSFLIQFSSVVRNLSSTYQSRIILGFSGNRIFQVARFLQDEIQSSSVFDGAWKRAFGPAVLSGAPYISFHPDHPANPMHNSAKMVWAMMGKVALTRVGSIDELAKFSSSLFIPPVLNSMSQHVGLVSGAMPDIGEFFAAVSKQYSVRGMTSN